MHQGAKYVHKIATMVVGRLIGLRKICCSNPKCSTFRVTTHLENLENLEKSGNSKVVRENGKSREVKSGVFFQALNTPKLVFRPGLRPRPLWVSLQHLAPDLSLIHI